MSKWYKASELERARTPMVMSSEMGLPDNHVITVTERVISIDNTELIQNNIATDTFTLVLDAEWDDITPVVIFSNDTSKYSVMYEGSATKIPAKAMERVGDIQVSVYGLNDEGDVRVVTQKPDSMGMTVIESGEFNGQVSADDVSLLGQILQAVSDAETAITEAETAITAATNATSQATSAATSANQAASSANSAASSANSAATRATSAAVNAENAYDTLQPYMATIDSCANILHREVGPDSVVTADDSFPCKPVEMVVYGNTVQNLWANPHGTQNGVTTTENSDGSVSFSGTTTAGISNWTCPPAVSYILKPSAQYTLSMSGGTQIGVEIIPYNSDGAYIPGGKITLYQPGSITFTAQTSVSYANFIFSTRVASGTTVSGTYRVMLNEGSTAEPWCPPGLNSVGDGGSVDIVTAGKNLIDFGKLNPAYYDVSGDGLKIVKPDEQAWKNIQPMLQLPPGDYTFRCAGASNFQISTRNVGDTDWGSSISSSPLHLSVTTEIAVKMFAYVGTTVYPQLELGSTATDYEPPNITTTPIDLQGHTLNSLPDGTRDELHIDGGGNVVLEKRCGVDVAPTSAGEWTWDAEYGRGLFGISPKAINVAGIGTLLCDKLPPREVQADATEGTYSLAATVSAYARVSTIDSLSELVPIAGGATYIYKLAEPQTIDLGTITPPTMAAPNVTAYVADDTPAEMELDYVRDINIVVDRLEAKIADLVTKEAANV